MVLLVRPCTICAAKGNIVPADYIAQNAEKLQWYECENHGPNDHNTMFGSGVRTAREHKDSWFKRHFPDAAARK